MKNQQGLQPVMCADEVAGKFRKLRLRTCWALLQQNKSTAGLREVPRDGLIILGGRVQD
jgi:hypothetical protein